jgi:hypothetical protein
MYKCALAGEAPLPLSSFPCPDVSKEARLQDLDQRASQLRARLTELNRRKRRIESAKHKARRRKETQAKIIYGVGAKAYLDKNPRDQWFRQFMRDFLKADPKLKTNEVLAEWAKSLASEKKGG